MMVENITENGMIRSYTVLAFTDGKMVNSIEVNMQMTRSMVSDSIHYKMVGHMKAGGMTANNMDSEHSFSKTVTNIRF